MFFYDDEGSTRGPHRLGATPLADGSTHFRVWAPRHWSVSVEVERDGGFFQPHALERDGDGYYAGVVGDAPAGSRYRFDVGDGGRYPDPASRRQPEGVHGPSEVVDPGAYRWGDEAWRGVAKRDLVVYELHVGAFTRSGTFRAAIERLPRLAELGVTAVELLPLAQTPGKWNWGYDGVGLFAVQHNYGSPDDLRALVDACHAAGLAVLVDVVYNHVGPEGNYLGKFGPYFSSKHGTPWGDALNFDGRRKAGARRFVVENVLYWLDEYRLDGLRLDAVHFMHDDSEHHILADVRRAVTDYAVRVGREVHLVAETNAHDAELLTPRDDREAYSALWCDCLMHSIHSHGAPDLRNTPRRYRGAPDVVQALRRGFVYHGKDFHRAILPEHDGAASEAEARSFLGSFITGLQTHDSVGNHPHGLRLHQLTSRAFQRAAAALTLLHPSVPMLFMGEEHAVDAPFRFFADFGDKRLRRAVDAGRRRDYAHHEWGDAPSPSEKRAFTESCIDDPEKQDAETFAWYRTLLALRKRGLAEGWLAADRMRVEYDEELGVFRLAYRRDEGGEIAVLARLTGVREDAGPDLQSVPVSGELLHSSEADASLVDGAVALGRDHAVVVG